MEKIDAYDFKDPKDLAGAEMAVHDRKVFLAMVQSLQSIAERLDDIATRMTP